MYHTNMLKKYTKRDEKATMNVIEVVSAALLEASDSTADDVVDDEELLELNYVKGKETYQDVKIAETLGEQKEQDVLGKIEGEIGLQQNNVEKIKATKPPQTKKEVRSFLGLTGYYRNYIPNYATIAAPLTDLTKKGCPNKVEWGDSQQKAFESLKCHLMNQPILRLPDMTKDFILRTDASDQGVGAVLMQECCNQLFPISFASKKFADRENATLSWKKSV